MPANALSHPDDGDLLAYAAGRLRARLRVPVEAHLAECARCVGRLDALLTRAKPDPLLARLRLAGGAKSVTDATPFTGGAAATWPLAPAPATPVAAAATYELLPGVRQVRGGVARQARQSPGDSVVTVTFPLPDALDSPEDRERVAAQVRVLNAVAHPNVAMPRALVRVGDAWGVVSDDADGIDLHALACADNRPGEALACDYVRQAARGLAAAHAAGVAHGDLKLADLLLFDRRTVRVAGFLAARLRPGPPPDPAADLPALGRCLAALLTGRASGAGLADAPPGYFARWHPQEVARVLGRLASDDPARRYATMADAADDLADLAPPPPRRPLWRRLFRPKP